MHLVALPTVENGCYLSPRMRKSLRFRYLAWKQNLPIDDASRFNRKYVDDLLFELGTSRFVKTVVLLAMDGVYASNGSLDLGKTEFLVSNQYVLGLAQSHPEKFWAGVSINPQRCDAIDELQRCVDAGAKLVKVLPNTQGFDPSNRQYLPFYRKLAQLQVPLLSHVGHEFALQAGDQSAGHPGKLRVPLDEGVTVIAAHGCSSGLMVFEPYHRTLLEMACRYKQFYADLSAMTLPNRLGMVFRLRRHPEVQRRLLFGTDYPLPVFYPPIPAFRTDNRFDRQYLVLKALGLNLRSFDSLAAAS